MIEPRLLCKKHLIGEHGELHKFRSSFEKGYKIDKRVCPVVQIEPLKMKERHDQLVEEMKIRGYNHKSSYEQPGLSKYNPDQLNVKADLEYNIKDLAARCEVCRKILEYNWVIIQT